MSRFYFILWFKWSVRLTFCSVILAFGLTSIFTLYLYVAQGMPILTTEVSLALITILKFWFPIVWSLTLLLVLFRSLKFIFNDCSNKYKFVLYSFDLKDKLDVIGYGDLLKVWRRWFILIIWIVGSIMILSLLYTSFFTLLNGVFEWFSIYWLYVFLLIAGYLSFIIMPSRCNRIKVLRC